MRKSNSQLGVAALFFTVERRLVGEFYLLLVFCELLPLNTILLLAQTEYHYLSSSSYTSVLASLECVCP